MLIKQSLKYWDLADWQIILVSKFSTKWSIITTGSLTLKTKTFLETMLQQCFSGLSPDGALSQLDSTAPHLKRMALKPYSWWGVLKLEAKQPVPGVEGFCRVSKSTINIKSNLLSLTAGIMRTSCVHRTLYLYLKIYTNYHY